MACRLLMPQSLDSPSRTARIANTNSGALRSHFSQLTAALLEPFDRFILPTSPPPGIDKPLPSKEAEPRNEADRNCACCQLNISRMEMFLLDRHSDFVLLSELCICQMRINSA